MSKGGAILPVVEIVDADLRENGGNYTLKSGAALPVEAIIAADIAVNENIQGGERTPIYVVNTGDAVRGTQGGKPQKIAAVISFPARGIKGNVAIPVFIVTGSLS